MDHRDVKEKVPELGAQGAFPVIWKLQLELVKKYQKIENLPSYPLNLDLKDNQELMKDFLARVTEELAEAYEALEKADIDNAKEEMADALHFIMEALIFATTQERVEFAYGKIGETTLFKDMAIGYYHDNVIEWFWETTYYLNLARNNLRNKRWKQTQVLAQKTLFFKNLISALHSLINGFHLWNMEEADIFEIYYKKNRINWFRIKSKY